MSSVKSDALAPPDTSLLVCAREHAKEARRLAGFAAALAATDYPVPPQSGVVMGQSLYREIGLEFLSYFLKWGDLDPSDDVLDIGCGGGRMAVPLTYYLDPSAMYVGFDTHEDSIRWCQNNISPRRPNFKFEAFDLQNARYNPNGTIKSKDFVFPYEDASFSFAIAISVFTHMPREDVKHYLKQIARILRRGGRAFCTAFMMTSEATHALATFKRGLTFDHMVGENPTHSLDEPLMAVAQMEGPLRTDIAAAGLIFERFVSGWWSGLPAVGTQQDIMLLRKP